MWVNWPHLSLLWVERLKKWVRSIAMTMSPDPVRRPSADGDRSHENSHGGHTGAVAADITRSVVKAVTDATGRGPTKARTHITKEVVTVVLQDTLTRLERTLVDHGHGDVVVTSRGVVHEALRPTLTTMVEGLTRASVQSAHFSHQAVADTSVLTFVLEQKA